MCGKLQCSFNHIWSLGVLYKNGPDFKFYYIINIIDEILPDNSTMRFFTCTACMVAGNRNRNRSKSGRIYLSALSDKYISAARGNLFPARLYRYTIAESQLCKLIRKYEVAQRRTK